MKTRVAGFALAVSVLVATGAAADILEQGRVGLSVNYPGAGIRYLLLDSVALELRGQYEREISAAGARGLWWVKEFGRHSPYYGIEFDYLAFRTDSVRGQGYYGGAFVGVETFLYEDVLSLQADIGPGYIWMRDRGVDVTASGIEFVVNFGVSYYL